MGGISSSVAAVASLLGGLIVGLVGAQPDVSTTDAVAPGGAGSLCLAGETPVFSCPLGRKLASVCGSGARAVYRYGAPGRVELTARTITLAKRSYAGGGETQIAVANKGYTYILYDRTVRTGFAADGRNDPDMTSGLLVRRAGRTISARRCDDDAPIPARAATFISAGGAVVAH